MKNIHITAVCPFFEIHEIIPETKAIRRLSLIKKNYESMKNRAGNKHDGKLKVITGIHNPTLF